MCQPFFFFALSYIAGQYISPTLKTGKHNNTLSKQLPMLLKHPSKNISKITLATKIALSPDSFRIIPCSNNGIYRPDV
jgi:hypothetical protein